MSDSESDARKRGRLSRSGDFDRAYRDGRSHANRHVVLYAFPREAEAPPGEELRLGISVGRKVGGAVQRNKVKRAMRESFWSLADGLPAGYDFVLVGRTGVAELLESGGSGRLRESISELLQKWGEQA